MSAAHTPGPWQLGDGTGDPVQSASVFAFSLSGELYMVCSTTGYFPYPVRDANARLIAAAPDMLAALRRAALALAFASETSPAMRDDYQAVSDAIDKATGSAS